MDVIFLVLVLMVPVHMISYRQGARDERAKHEKKILKQGDIMDMAEGVTLEVTSGTVTVEPKDGEVWTS